MGYTLTELETIIFGVSTSMIRVLQIGMVYLHKGKPVYIYDGQWEGRNGISNFWFWKRIRKDGSLGKKYCGYNNMGEFSEYPNDWEMKIILKE